MEADTLENRYLKTTKRFAKLSGIWPYESKFSKYLARSITTVVVTIGVVTQMAKMVCFFSGDSVMEVLPFATTLLGVLIKLWNLIIYEEEFKLLLDGMYEDWSANRSKEEIDIMTVYAKRGAFFTSFYLGNAYVCVFAFINLPNIPPILDKILPQNESRSRFLIYPAYYGLDEEKYYYFITAHMSSVIVMVLFVFGTYDTIYAYMVQHACGLLTVSGYRFKYAVENCLNDGKEKSVENDDEIYKKVCFAIQAHERANLYMKEIGSIQFHCLFLMLTLITITFSLTLVKISIMDITVDFYKDCSYLIVQLMHMFFLTIQGQFLIDSNNEAYNSIYEGSWYNASVKTQMLYLLALRKTLEPRVITAGGFVTMNLNTFSEVFKTSVSYFTVLKSI